MERHSKTDFSEIAQLILDGIVAFPKEFLVSFCLPHDCFRDRKYSPDAETVREVKQTFKLLAEKYDLIGDEPKIITSWDSHFCNSNPLLQLADRWMAQKASEDNARLSGNWGIWYMNGLVILDFRRPEVDREIARCIFNETEGKQRVRLNRQLDRDGYILRESWNMPVPKVMVKNRLGGSFKEPFEVDIYSILYQKQSFLFSPESQLLLGFVEDFNGLIFGHDRNWLYGIFVWSKDEDEVYRVKGEILLEKPPNSDNSLRILSSFLPTVSLPLM